MDYGAPGQMTDAIPEGLKRAEIQHENLCTGVTEIVYSSTGENSLSQQWLIIQ